MDFVINLIKCHFHWLCSAMRAICSKKIKLYPTKNMKLLLYCIHNDATNDLEISLKSKFSQLSNGIKAQYVTFGGKFL